MPAFARQLNTSSPSSIAIERLRVQEDNLASLLRRLGPNDPDVLSVRRQIETSKRDIEATTRTYADGLGEQVRALDARIAALREDVQLLPAQQVEYARLLREQKGVEDVMTQVQGRLKEAEITAAVQDSTAQVLDRAELPCSSLGTSKPVIFAVALFAGLLVGVLVAFMRDWLDTTVHNEQDVTALVRAPVIGIIPNLRQDAFASKARSLLGREPATTALAPAKPVREAESQTMAAEAYRALRTNLSYVSPAKPPRVIVVTSALSGDGKTTSASNLAVTLAQQNKRVLLIDADMRKGWVHQMLQVSNERGLSNLLSGDRSSDALIQETTVANLGVITAGPVPPDPVELLMGPRLGLLLEKAQAMGYQQIVIDGPPLLGIADAIVLGNQIQHIVFSVKAGGTRKDSIRDALRRLRNAGLVPMGMVLTHARNEHTSDYAYAAYYGHGYGDGYTPPRAARPAPAPSPSRPPVPLPSGTRIEPTLDPSGA